MCHEKARASLAVSNPATSLIPDTRILSEDELENTFSSTSLRYVYLNYCAFTLSIISCLLLLLVMRRHRIFLYCFSGSRCDM